MSSDDDKPANKADEKPMTRSEIARQEALASMHETARRSRWTVRNERHKRKPS
ncbi:MAG: hypothetical protein JNM89_02205 [Hyphomicrobiaceae bacterium]|nr:hypothetical protein [Hyphomicrobiaceae bacterium]